MHVNENLWKLPKKINSFSSASKISRLITTCPHGSDKKFREKRCWKTSVSILWWPRMHILNLTLSSARETSLQPQWQEATTRKRDTLIRITCRQRTMLPTRLSKKKPFTMEITTWAMESTTLRCLSHKLTTLSFLPSMWSFLTRSSLKSRVQR